MARSSRCPGFNCERVIVPVIFSIHHRLSDVATWMFPSPAVPEAHAVVPHGIQLVSLTFIGAETDWADLSAAKHKCILATVFGSLLGILARTGASPKPRSLSRSRAFPHTLDCSIPVSNLPELRP